MHFTKRRGVSGLEATILVIVIVIVAAALAFVVLNMGFSTTQKAKTTIASGLGQVSSGLEVSGAVFGYGSSSQLRVLAIPIKVVAGGESVNLGTTTASIKYISNSVTYDNIYNGALYTGSQDTDGSADGQWSSLSGAATDATTQSFISANPTSGNPASTKAWIYWTVNRNTNTILDEGEHAVIAVGYYANERPSALDKLRVEVVVPTGAPLTVERQVPSITTTYVDLG